jgi:hypothetical protein
MIKFHKHYHHHHFLSQVFFLPWYFSSWASGEPHHSGFKSQLEALSLRCVMFLVWQLLLLLLLLLLLFRFFAATECSEGFWDYAVCQCLYDLSPEELHCSIIICISIILYFLLTLWGQTELPFRLGHYCYLYVSKATKRILYFPLGIVLRYSPSSRCATAANDKRRVLTFSVKTVYLFRTISRDEKSF